MSKIRSYMRNQKQEGFIVSVELIFIVTILVIGLLVGWVAIRDAVVAELHDVSEAVGALDQSFSFTGTNGGVILANTEGSTFDDAIDNANTVPGAILAGDRAVVSVITPAAGNEGP